MGMAQQTMGEPVFTLHSFDTEGPIRIYGTFGVRGVNTRINQPMTNPKGDREEEAPC